MSAEQREVGEKYPDPHPDAQGEAVVTVRSVGLTDEQLDALDAWAGATFGEDLILEGSAETITYLVPSNRQGVANSG